MNTALASWMIYAAGVAVLVSLAGVFAESALRHSGRPVRGAWATAMAASVLIPVATLLGVPALVRPATPLAEGALVTLPPLVVGLGAESAAGTGYGDVLLLGLWGAASLMLALYFGWSMLRLQRARRGWRREQVGGLPVLVTGDVGPAAVGGSILLPEWALSADARLRRLMLMHEEEHVRARDPWLLLAGLGVAVALPWNLALWWQLQRMRQAVELDCDARVLRREPDAHLYGTLLVEVGRHQGGSHLVVAFSQPRAVLERRILAIADGVRRNHGRAAGLALASSLVVTLAVCAGDPLSPRAVGDLEAPEPAPAIAPDVEAGTRTAVVPGRGDISEGPTFTPMTVAPELRNRADVAQALADNYPPMLRDAGIGGNPTVWLLIGEDGALRQVRLNESSGYSELDAAALRVAETMRFSPALNRDQRVAVWVSIPIVFIPRDSQVRPRAEPAAAAAAAAVRSTQRSAGGSPPFTPMTVAPQLRNAAEVARILEANYPPLLRDAGIGGEVTLWAHVDASGEVTDLRLQRSSGHDELDRAARTVIESMRFSPALLGSESTAVWVALPVIFRPRP